MATDGQLVVVGVDGSAESVAALKWAAAYAAAIRARLRVVMAWHYPAAVGPAPVGVAPAAVTDEVRRHVNEALGKTVAEAAVGEDLDVEKQVGYGHPAQVLVDESAGSDLLVVGNRGHGAFTGMMVGSVSIHCVTHAHCPVVVVRSDSR
jgi:nucleotide-binding universal stress UspA family protein